MPKAEWGVKRVCPTTGKRFYDLNRTPIVSPYTGEVVDIELSRRKATASIVQRAAAAKAEDALVDDLDTDVDLLEADVGDDNDIDDELLEDDEEDTVSLDDLTEVGGGEDEG